MREDVIASIERYKIIAIIRGVEIEKCVKVADALYNGGIKLMEITFDLKRPESFIETARSISLVSETCKGRILIGAGTVTSPELVDIAADAGAQYIISPDTNPSVIHRTLERGLVSLPGAMTPTEIITAYNAGADFVKLFPASNLGPRYVKAICAPLSHVKLLAVGGVNEKNVSEFLSASVVGVGVGGNLANKTWIDNGEYEKIVVAARGLVAAVES